MAAVVLVYFSGNLPNFTQEMEGFGPNNLAGLLKWNRILKPLNPVKVESWVRVHISQKQNHYVNFPVILAERSYRKILGKECLFECFWEAFNLPRSCQQELNYVELFAGVGNVWRAVSESGYPAARADLAYYEVEEGYENKQNPMDILSSAGFANLDCIS